MSRKPLTVHPTQVPRVLTMLGAEGTIAQERAINELVEEMRNKLLRRPTKRTCQCMCGCKNVWTDRYDWLRSMGSCSKCQDPEHQEEILERVRRILR